jgi:hypothetical protein
MLFAYLERKQNSMTLSPRMRTLPPTMEKVKQQPARIIEYGISILIMFLDIAKLVEKRFKQEKILQEYWG